MSTYTIEHTLTLTVVHCCRCGVPFAIPTGLQKSLVDTGEIFYCPSGHQQHFTESSEKKLERLSRELDATRESELWWKEQAEGAGKRLISMRGQLTKAKNRIAKGVCPCCHRQFVQLARHMQTKHPGYSEESK